LGFAKEVPTILGEAPAVARRFEKLDDSRLAARVHRGDEAAFEVLYDRHHRALLSFCRHMLGNAEDGEDALQQTFLRAHKALVAGQLPDAVRPWLFAIARNRCKTMLAARREACVPVDEVEPAFDGLDESVAARADLRELVADLGRLPEDQRAALVLFELGGLSQAEIGGAIGVPSGKVKALVFQARTELMAERDARATPCETIREELAVARGGALRRGPLRRHLRNCASCDAYRVAVAEQRAGLASILPVDPAVGLKAAVLGGIAAGGSAAAGGAALLSVAGKLAVIAALLGGAGAGAGAIVERSEAPARVEPAAARATVTPTPTPTVTSTATPTATPQQAAKKRKPSRHRKARPKRGRSSDRKFRTPSPAPSAPSAPATPVSSPAPTPAATAAAATGVHGGGAKPSRRPAAERAVRGVVEEAPPPPPEPEQPVLGEVAEPDPVAPPSKQAAPATGSAPAEPPSAP
jgi:RNA polymerase sigma factor (sigma-70 family)